MERTIKLSSLFLYPLYHWKSILCTALVFLILGGAVTMLPAKTEGSAESTPQMTEEQISEKHELENKVAYLRDKLSAIEYYLENSSLMNTNPFHLWKAQLIISVSSQNDESDTLWQRQEQAAPVMVSYQILLDSTDFAEKIASKLNMEIWQVRELLNANTEKGDVLEVLVSGTSQEQAEEIMRLVKESLPQLEKLLAQSYGEIESHVLLDSCYQEYDSKLAETRDGLLNTLKTDRETLKTEEEALKQFVPAPQEAVSGNAKKIILFPVVGLFLSFVFWDLQLCFTRKVYSLTDLQQIKNLSSLGTVAPAKKMDRFSKAVRRAEERNVSDPEDSYALIAANILTLAGDAKKILLTGDCGSDTCKSAAETLQKLLPEKELIFSGSLLSDPACVAFMNNCDGVILLEQCMVSNFNHIVREIRQIQDADKPLVGCALIEL